MEKRLEQILLKMLEKAERKLKAARKLCQEEMYEDAISRAYYAMYHAALALLLTKGVSPRTHSGMLTMLSLHFVKSAELPDEYFRMISKDKELRENGDYELFYDGTSEETEMVVDDACKFVKKVKEMLNL